MLCTSPSKYSVTLFSNGPVQGQSLVPLIDGSAKALANASFSQYPRGTQNDAVTSGHSFFAGGDGASPCLSKKCTMGYSMITKLNDKEYRYTEWVGFNGRVKNGPDWSDSVGVELYDMTVGGTWYEVVPLCVQVNLVMNNNSILAGPMSMWQLRQPIPPLCNNYRPCCEPVRRQVCSMSPYRF